MLPFPSFYLAAITAEEDALSRCDDFGCSVLFGLLQFDNVSTTRSTRPKKGIDLTDTVNAVDPCWAGVEGVQRELVQPRPRPGGLMFDAGGPSCHPVPSSLFLSECLRPFGSF